jgi:DNA gyrase subunit A
VAEIREMGRATQGVTLIALDQGTTLTGLQRIVESDADTHGNGHVSDADDSDAAAGDADASTPETP